MIRPHQSNALWLAWMLHRYSGLALALFLPLHFLMLGQALEGEAVLETSLRWTDNILFKIAEYGLVFLLAVHFLGGLRIMALEFLPWSNRQKTYAASALALAFAIATGFFLTAIAL